MNVQLTKPLKGQCGPQLHSVVMAAYRCWAEDCVGLVALAKLTQLVLTKRVGGAVL